jgi:superfamily I DNA/RNA helicase
MSLTEEQQGVVRCADGFNLVCALPGSGKTHTSVSVADAILKLSDSYSVGMVTFTKASAMEMTQRVKDRIGGDIFISQDKVKCSTFHSFVLEQWRNYKPGFVLIIGTKQSNIINRALNNSKFEGSYEDACQVLDFYGQQLYPQPVAKDASNTWDLYQTYFQIIMSTSGLDFSMIFRNVILAMRENKIPVLAFTHLLCDEFQDTDNIQYAWLQEHASRGVKITAVGDDDQSIYGFRHSQGYAVMKKFQDEFKAVGHVLSTCFRCRPEILDAAQKVVEFNEDRVHKDMASHADLGGEVHIYGFESKNSEAEKVIELLYEHEGEEFAILARNNSQLDLVEGILKAKDIEYNRKIKSGFWELPQVDSFLKILYSIAAPYDVRYINEVLGFLEEDEEEIVILTKESRENQGFFAISDNVLENCRATTKQLHQFFIMIGYDTEDQEMIRKRIDTLINLIADAKGKKDGNGLAAAKAVGNILVKHYEGSLHERIDDIVYRLRPKFEKESNEKEENSPKITLSTLHGSKGLEWRNVIVLGVSEGTFPSSKSTSLDEERRLLYVGMTRAEQRLYMLYNGIPSEFLVEAFPNMFSEVFEDAEEDW